jgi:hypothetical protein
VTGDIIRGAMRDKKDPVLVDWNYSIGGQPELRFESYESHTFEIYWLPRMISYDRI